MNSPTEKKFNAIVRHGLQELLRTRGFKKFRYDFYAGLGGIGHVINVHKSFSSSTDRIRFTINTGVFLPEFWEVSFNHYGFPVPLFPLETECVVRMSIGALRNESEKWYDVNDEADENILVKEMQDHVQQYILPHFEKILSKDNLVDFLDSETYGVNELEKLVVFGELGLRDKAKKLFEELVTGAQGKPVFMATIKSYGEPYGLK